MVRFAIEIEDETVRAALARLAEAAGDLGPAMQDIGELLTERTKRRFATGTGPDGRPWAPNAPSTIARKGHGQPLIGETRRLSGEIFWQLEAGGQGVTVGSALVYAAVQQFGARRGQFGATRRGAPIPLGNIPARPFVGASEADLDDVADILAEHLAAATGAAP